MTAVTAVAMAAAIAQKKLFDGFLLIVLFAVNFLALDILRMFDLAGLLLGDFAVGLRPVFHLLHMGLTLLQACSFALI